MRVHDQSSIFSIGGKFRPDYGLLLELHALTLVARSYALLLIIMRIPYQQLKENEILATKLSYLISVLLRCKLSGVASTLNDLVP